MRRVYSSATKAIASVVRWIVTGIVSLIVALPIFASIPTSV